MKSIGLIGCGAWGKNILRDLIQLNCTVYVVDMEEEAKTRALKLGAAEVYSDADGLPPCDAYVVAVPIPDLTKECARLLCHQKPIFSEKTLCLSMDDYNLLTGLGGADFIFVMHKWHYHPGIEALRQLAESGKIGAIDMLCTYRHAWVDDFHGGDVFWTQAIHDLTVIKHILGYIPDEIQTIRVVRNEDQLPVSCVAMYKDKPTVVMSVSGMHCNKISGVSIHGNKGTAGLHNALDDHIVVRSGIGEEKIPIDTTFPLYIELKEFIDYLDGGPVPRCNLENAKEVMQAILNLRESAGLKV